MSRKPRIADKNPLIVHYEKIDVAALQALARGEATEGQQKRALDFIVNGISAAFDVCYRPGANDETHFALGKAFVGQKIDGFVRLNLSLIKEPPNVRPSESHAPRSAGTGSTGT